MFFPWPCVCCWEDFWSYRTSYLVPTKIISSYARANMGGRKVLMGEVTEEVNEENKQIIYLSIYLSNLDTQCTNDHT